MTLSDNLLKINDQSSAECAYEKDADNPSGSETNGQNRSDSSSAGEVLLNSISPKTDFPTFSKAIIEINRQITSRSKYSSASDLSNAILKDYALTSKLLKLVNSAFYGLTNGKITTITRAVVLLGYKRVSLAATSLLLFDLMKSKSSAGELKEAFIKAFWSGLVAKDVADTMSVNENEEALICAMLHNLGKHIILLYLPDKYQEISNLISDKAFSETKASKSVLGITFENLSIAVARLWKFPTKIITSMERLSSDDLQKSKGKIDFLKALSNFSNDLCSIVNNTSGEDREASFSELVSHYKNHVPLSVKQLSDIVNTSLEKVRKHADLLEINIEGTHFLKRLTLGNKNQNFEQNDQTFGSEFDLEVSKVLVDNQSDPDAAYRRQIDAQQANPAEVIFSGIQDMSAAMVGDFKVNDIALMALESMYRGLGFNRVIFFTMRKDKKRLEARFGFGADIKKIVNQVYFETDGSPDIFNIALAKDKDLIIEDTHAKHIYEFIPGWYRKKISAPAFIFLPVTYEKSCLGAFYADRKKAGPPLQAGQYKFMTMLRNQLILAIKFRK
jgi:HD-like signal output (HDOD) protein